MEKEDGGGQKNGQLCSRPVKIVEPKEGRLISLHVSLPFLDNDEHLAPLFSLFFLVYFYVTPSPVPLFHSPLFTFHFSEESPVGVHKVPEGNWMLAYSQTCPSLSAD